MNLFINIWKEKKRLKTLDSLGWTVGSQMALRSSFSFASSVVFPALSRPRNSTLPFLECKPTSKARACAGSEHSGIGNVWRAMGTVHSKCAETCMWWHLKPTDTQFDAVADDWTYQAWLKVHKTSWPKTYFLLFQVDKQRKVLRNSGLQRVTPGVRKLRVRDTQGAIEGKTSSNIIMATMFTSSGPMQLPLDAVPAG